MIPERSLEVLRAIVDDYIANREPVGSKALVDRHQFNVSSATIRNDMALLEEEGLIVAPHTSSGRVPTDKGYRVFVDRLDEVKPLKAAEKHAIETFLSGSNNIDDMLSRAAQLLSQLTNQVALVQYPNLTSQKLRSIELLKVTTSTVLIVLITDSGLVHQIYGHLVSDFGDAELADLRARFNAVSAGQNIYEAASKLEKLLTTLSPALRQNAAVLVAEIKTALEPKGKERMVLAGTANLARRDYDFGGSITPILEAIEEQVTLLRLIDEMQNDQWGVGLRIGAENENESLSATSVMVTGYENQGSELAKIGVLGPTRMDYSSNIAAVKAVASYLSKELGAK
jgi:heat-inducible transcriptional repressor